jgi:molybdenum cofactor guanylyltransferase
MSGVRTRISAAILAGGQARRLGGVDKPLLVIDPRTGTRIIDRQLAALAGLADEILIVTNTPDRYADLSLPRIPDAIAGAGSLGGLYSALRAAAHPLVLVLAGDLPFVTRHLLDRLMAEAGADDIDAVVPRSSQGLQPLCAIYRTRVLPAMERRIEAGHLQIGAFVRGLHVRELGPDILAEYDRDGRLFDNINTPHDYASARERMELMVEPSANRITE